jgi:hypothetical protein
MSKLFINRETIRILSDTFGFGVHGDFIVTMPESLAGLTGWDLEFRTVWQAVEFRNAMLAHVVDVNIRQGDSVSDLDKPVVLTIICPEN